MDAFIWVAILVLVSGLTAVATYAHTRLRMQRVFQQREKELTDALAAIEAERKSFQETTRAVEESVRRKAMDEFLSDMRVEERHYIRQHKVLFATKKSLVMQERVFFRNIPLSNWVEHEVPVEEGADLEALAKTLSVFNNALEGAAPAPPRRFLSRSH